MKRLQGFFFISCCLFSSLHVGAPALGDYLSAHSVKTANLENPASNGRLSKIFKTKIAKEIIHFRKHKYENEIRLTFNTGLFFLSTLFFYLILLYVEKYFSQRLFGLQLRSPPAVF